MPVRTPLYDLDARRKTVSVTPNEDLMAKATANGINTSRTAEEALACAFADLERTRIKQELREAVRMVDEYMAIHGMPFDEWASKAESDANHGA